MKHVELIIEGRPASKKNSRRNFGHVSLPSKAYERFKQDALWQLKSCRERFTTPVRVTYVFYHKGKLEQDVDNAIASINDVLQEAGILADDKLVVAGSFVKTFGHTSWRTVIEIDELDS